MLFIIQHKMNLFLNKSLRIVLKTCRAMLPRIAYRFSSEEYDFLILKEVFRKEQDMVVFNDIIHKSNNSMDNINYFRIFKILEDNHSPVKHYEDLFLQINATVKKKSDNVRMLLAKIKVRIAMKCQQTKDYKTTLRHLQEGLQVLEDSLIPPVLLYYQLYRYYGHVQKALGNKQEAVQALSQSVDMIQRYLEHSDDQVTSNENCKSQAKAYNALVELDPSKADEWLKKANESWEDYSGNRFDLEDYADTIIHNARKEYRQSKEKGEGYLMFNFYQFKKQHLKQKLIQIKGEYCK